MDETGRPLYGDVFGTAQPELPPEIAAPIERKHWGELLPEEEVEEPEEASEASEPAGEGEEEGHPEPEESGTRTETGISSVPPGLETPDTIDLRKRKEAPTVEGEARPLFEVLQQQDANVGGAVYGSAHKYVVPAEGREKAGRDRNKVDLIKSQKTEKINVTLDPSELETAEELNEDLIKKKYAKALADKADANTKEDVSDIIAEQAKKRQKKDQKSDQRSKKPKDKDFKF